MGKHYLIVFIVIISFLGCYPVKKTIKLNDISPELNETHIVFKDSNIILFVKQKHFFERLTEIDDKNFQKGLENYLEAHNIIYLPESNISASCEEIAFLFNRLYEEVLNGDVKIFYENQGDTTKVEKIEYYKIKGDLGSIQSYFKYKNLIFLPKLHSLGE